MNSKKFLDKFSFDPGKALFIGVEREAFTKRNNVILPLTPIILPLIENSQPKYQVFGYELSACQIEMRYGPCKLTNLKTVLTYADAEFKKFERILNFKGYFADVAGENLVLDVYPDPTGRYGALAKTLEKQVLHAACYVAGTHVHIGMPSIEDALRVYNNVCKHVHDLISLGDNSQGERMRYYGLMAKKINPEPHVDLESFSQHAIKDGYNEDPRKCWTLIRISIHGTIEFRMFGSTPHLKKIHEWAEICHALCKKYL